MTGAFGSAAWLVGDVFGNPTFLSPTSVILTSNGTYDGFLSAETINVNTNGLFFECSLPPVADASSDSLSVGGSYWWTVLSQGIWRYFNIRILL
jgi:hypothetical protein